MDFLMDHIGLCAAIIAAVLLLILFFVYLIYFRNKMIREREIIQKTRGDVNNAKAYLDIVSHRGTLRGFFINLFTLGKGSKKSLEAEGTYLEARKKLDALVHPYNQKIQIFPNNIFARILKLKQEAYADNSK